MHTIHEVSWVGTSGCFSDKVCRCPGYSIFGFPFLKALFIPYQQQGLEMLGMRWQHWQGRSDLAFKRNWHCSGTLFRKGFKGLFGSTYFDDAGVLPHQWVKLFAPGLGSCDSSAGRGQGQIVILLHLRGHINDAHLQQEAVANLSNGVAQRMWVFNFK
jgi:hypothetical protein